MVAHPIRLAFYRFIVLLASVLAVLAAAAAAVTAARYYFLVAVGAYKLVVVLEHYDFFGFLES